MGDLWIIKTIFCDDYRSLLKEIFAEWDKKMEEEVERKERTE